LLFLPDIQAAAVDSAAIEEGRIMRTGILPEAGRTGVVALGLILGGAATLTATATLAQDVVCAPRETLANELARDFGERPIGLGLSTRGSILELFKSADGQTWTLVSTRPTGVSCILDAGANWATQDPAEQVSGLES
jgi:hypothetical protein